MGGTTVGRTAGVMPGLDITQQRAWENFLDASLRLHGTLNRALSAGHRLTLVDVRLLDILSRSESGAARMGDLAEQLVALPSRVTRQISRLEAAGLVRREASPEDGRGVLAAITEQGREALAAAIVTYSDGVRQLFVRPLTRPQMSAIGDHCRRISTNISTKLRTDGLDGRTARV